jgi:hypothetical protein
MPAMPSLSLGNKLTMTSMRVQNSALDRMFAIAFWRPSTSALARPTLNWSPILADGAWAGHMVRFIIEFGQCNLHPAAATLRSLSLRRVRAVASH